MAPMQNHQNEPAALPFPLPEMTRQRAAIQADTLAQFATHKDRVAAVLAAADVYDHAQGILRITAEELQQVRDDAWKRGYDHCREGNQRHSPYQAPRTPPAPGA
jgi:hypothetical protein